MAGVMIVETRCSSPEELESYHRWYDEVHIPEMLEVEGFRSARRFAAADGDSFLAIYEIDVDLPTAMAALDAARAAGDRSKPVGVATDPPPVIRFFESLG